MQNAHGMFAAGTHGANDMRVFECIGLLGRDPFRGDVCQVS